MKLRLHWAISIVILCACGTAVPVLDGADAGGDGGDAGDSSQRDTSADPDTGSTDSGADGDVGTDTSVSVDHYFQTVPATIDFWVGTFLILIMAMVEIICFSWIFGMDVGWDEIHHGAQIQIPTAFRFIMKYVSPLYLLIVLGAFCVTTLPSSLALIGQQPMAQLALALVGVVLLVLMVCVRIGEKRWAELGLDLDGKEGWANASPESPNREVAP